MRVVINQRFTAFPTKNIWLIRVAPEDDLSITIRDVLVELGNFTWLNRLNEEFMKTALSITAQETLDDITAKFNDETNDKYRSNVGQYLVSVLAKKAVVQEHRHLDMPLLELIGLRKSGNPGFDFYTEDNIRKMMFCGEAKFLSNTNAYGRALKQVSGFIKTKKHLKDAKELNGLASTESLNNMKTAVVCTIAFSSKSTSTVDLIKGIQANSEFKELLLNHNDILCGSGCCMNKVFDTIFGDDLVEVEKLISDCLAKLFSDGAQDKVILEILTYIKIYHPEIFNKYESQILARMGLFFKPMEFNSFEDNIFKVYQKFLQSKFEDIMTPVQADIINKIENNQAFSFSSPTSTGKSHIFRHILRTAQNDVVIIVPSRALINEYQKRVKKELAGQNINVLTFIDRINTKKSSRSVFIVTPERTRELFTRKNEFNIALFLFDEAQLSEDIKSSRGMFYDSVIRRAIRNFKDSKFVFAYPFVDNPKAQFTKNQIDISDKQEAIRIAFHSLYAQANGL